jgi:hypothetical protein
VLLKVAMTALLPVNQQTARPGDVNAVGGRTEMAAAAVNVEDRGVHQ